MLDYEIFCQIRDHLVRQRLSVAQTARALALDPRTVAKWASVEQFHPRAGVPRVSKLDAYKGQVVRWLDTHPYSAQQIFQRLREAGYAGGLTIVKDYVHRIRPRHPEAFLKLDFAVGECAQADWGEYGSIAVGSTRRRLSFFLMVLCYSRLMYLEFTVSQKMEFFLACHENAFAAFGGV
ncbi:MAG: IS21 family transposase, partial [Pseudomonadota bacterium]